mgnify:CR=1 FL=1
MTVQTSAQEIANEMATELFDAIEQELYAAITEKLGTDEWSGDELTSRITKDVKQSDPSQATYYLDGERILEQYGLQFGGTTRDRVAYIDLWRVGLEHMDEPLRLSIAGDFSDELEDDAHDPEA